MIRSITLTNFQAHESRAFELRAGVNTFTGPSDTGKSSIIRAIGWLALHGNQDFTRHGHTECSVSATTDTGTVTRFRGKRNGYTVNGEDYVAVGTNQPVPVRQVLSLSDINLQLQHDAPYLLSLTPGQIAKEINKVVDLSVIDACVAFCKKTIAKETTILRAVESEIAGLTEKRESLSWVPAAQEAWNTLEGLRKSVDEINERISKIEDTARNIREVNATGKSANAVARALQEFLGSVPEIRDDRELANVIMQYRESTVKIAELDGLISAFSVFPGLLQQIRDNDVRYMDVSNCISDILESGNELAKANEEIGRLEELLGVCPLCNQSFNRDSINGRPVNNCCERKT